MMENKTKKKQVLSSILKELEKVLHAAVDANIEKNLSPYEMLLISIQTLYDNSNKKKRDSKVKQPLAKVFHFPNRHRLFSPGQSDDDDKNGA